jgi:hypothetical protein
MSGKAAVPTLRSGDRATDAFGQAVKQNLDWLTGQTRNQAPLKALASTATLAEVIEQVNNQRKRLDFNA